MSYKNTEANIQKTMEKTNLKLVQNGHIFISGTYENRQSKLIICCPHHGNQIFETTFYNYNRSRTGTPCCGKAQTSEKLKNRQFSEATLEKMKTSALTRPKRNGKPRTWRKNYQYRQWRKAVFQNAKFRCEITGKKAKKPGDLVAHHLYCAKQHPNLIYIPENGIVLCKEIHNAFHRHYTYGSNTLEQFQDFLMLISSQANLKELDGSETRVYNLKLTNIKRAKIMNLHERLGRLSEALASLSFSNEKVASLNLHDIVRNSKEIWRRIY
jgi:hypothetical protein